MMTDHLPAFKILFKYFKPKKFLEFGLGESTSFFCDNCGSVTSIELACNNTHEEWYKKIAGLKLKNWYGILTKTTDSYNDQIKEMAESIVDDFDVIFIDPGVHCRAEIVNLCFNRAPIIIAHDTNHNAYGWEKVNKPDNYFTTVYKYGSGTTFWIKDKDLMENIELELAS